MKKINAFTLSEVLIALLVLGIIIAASVPSIMRLSPNKNAAMMKKAYYTTETIINELINDAYYYPEVNSAGTSTDGFNNTDNKTVAGTAITTNSTRKLQCLFASKLNIQESIAEVCAAGGTDVVTTMDGMTWNLGGLSNGAAAGRVEIDVDGKNNGVNSYNGSDLKACANSDTWYTSCNGDLDSYKQKKFDRISITITRAGQISIGHTQTALINILNGTTDIIGGDDD